METLVKTLPQNAECILQLAQAIVSQHIQHGVNSPLKVNHVAEINAKASAARSKHEEGMRFLKFAQELFRERDQLLGMGQPESLPQNILYHIHSVLDSLLEAGENPQALAQWGFAKE